MSPESTLFDHRLATDLQSAAIVAVLIIDDHRDAEPLARALLEGGVTAIELTLRTPAALRSLELIRRQVPEMLVGAGTILTPAQVHQARDAGAMFGVAPGLNRQVIDAARNAGFSFAPGICTPSEIEAAIERGCRLLKFFPAEASGGLHYLKSIHAPYDHLQLQYLPLGGLTTVNVQSYLADSIVHSVGGSWLAPRERIRERDWDSIRGNAREASRLADAIRRRGGVDR